MKVNVMEVIVNRISGKAMQETVPGQDHEELRKSKKAPEMRDTTVGSAIAGAILHPNAMQTESGNKLSPEMVRERYKLANRFIDAMEEGGSGEVELSAKEAALVQEIACLVYSNIVVSGKICEVLDG